MSRAKQAKGREWKVKNDKKLEDNESIKKEDKSISEEEHQKRIELLKNLGLLKE